MTADLRAIFDDAAGDYSPYASSPLTARVLEAVLVRARRLIPAGSAILDVGSGPGTFAVPLAKAGYRVTAVDVAPRMLEALTSEAERQGLEVRTVCADVRAGLAGIAPHDAAISIHGPLNYYEDPVEVAAPILRRVRPGGLVLFAFSRGASLEHVARHPRRAFLPLLTGRSMHVRPQLGGRTFSLFLHDPDTLVRDLSPLMDIVEVGPCGISLRVPPVLDRIVAKAPVLRRLGASTLIVGRSH